MTSTMTSDVTPAAPGRRTRPFYWSVRRELWENRSVYIAPLIAAGVVLVGVLVSALHLIHFRVSSQGVSRDALESLPPDAPYMTAAFVIYVAALLVGVFYSLGALHGERRDRSILFWKSLPVSDTTTVLAKAAVPLVVLPVVGFVLIAAVQLVILVIGLISALVSGQDTAAAGAPVPLLGIIGSELYQLAATIPWYAPVWGWLLMVSAWTRHRRPGLWGLGAPLAACVLERLALGTSHLAALIGHRLGDVSSLAFDHTGHGPGLDFQPPMDPVKFLTSPELWIGLVVAAAFLAAAVWLRRRQEPI